MSGLRPFIIAEVDKFGVNEKNQVFRSTRRSMNLWCSCIGKIDISYTYIYNYMRKIVDFIRYENISDMGKMN